MMSSFYLTLRAKKDLRTIWRYSISRWGEAQADSYITGLHQRFAWLAEHPNTGKRRNDIKQGYYSFPHKKHTIFYTINQDDINIIGVIGDGQSLKKYFQ